MSNQVPRLAYGQTTASQNVRVLNPSTEHLSSFPGLSQPKTKEEREANLRKILENKQHPKPPAKTQNNSKKNTTTTNPQNPTNGGKRRVRKTRTRKNRRSTKRRR